MLKMADSLRVAAGLILCAISGLARSADNRTILINQSDFGSNLGFYLDLENQGPDGMTLHAGTMKLILGAADGNRWHFVFSHNPLPVGKIIEVKAVINGGTESLFIDGRKVGDDAVTLAPFDHPLTIDDNPSWASAPTDYYVEQGEYRVECGGDAVAGEAPHLPPILRLFESPRPVETAFKADAQAAVTIITSFIVKPGVPISLDGAIDRYGQASAANWPQKVHANYDIIHSQTEEWQRTKDWTRPTNWDRFGGDRSAPWHLKPTGYFTVAKHGNVWWLISPEGYPLFYTGLCTAPSTKWETTPVDGREKIFEALPPKEGVTASIWTDYSPWDGHPLKSVGLQSWNLIRKFGADWDSKARLECAKRLGAWGFTGQGKWAEALPRTPYVPVLELGGVPKLVRHPDPFDLDVQKKIVESLRRQISSMKDDPYVVGYSIGNEYDEIVTAAEIETIRKDHPDSAAAIAMKKNIDSLPIHEVGLERYRDYYAAAYYSFLYKTMKSLDPNHLYFGFWIVPGWWENRNDWTLITPYCDVIGYDRYARSYSGIEQFLKQADKPTLVGEYSFPAWYGGQRGFGRFGPCFVETDADSGTHYAQWIKDASLDPKCVGALYFQYRDEPITGRGPGSGPQLVLGEHFAFGFVDDTDRPKWDLVTPARTANLRATKDRLAITQ